MGFTRFSARTIIISDDDSGSDICNNPSYFECPQGVIIGDIGIAILLFAFAIVIWKTGCLIKQKKDKTAADESNSKEDNRLPLPYPQPPSGMYEATKGVGPNSSTSTLVDPYLVPKNFNNSLISKDDYSFKRTTMPKPILKRKESVAGNHSAVRFDLPDPMPVTATRFDLPDPMPVTATRFDLPEPMPVVAHQLPDLKLEPITIQLHDDDGGNINDDKKPTTTSNLLDKRPASPPSPPPSTATANIHSSHSET